MEPSYNPFMDELLGHDGNVILYLSSGQSLEGRPIDWKKIQVAGEFIGCYLILEQPMGTRTHVLFEAVMGYSLHLV